MILTWNKKEKQIIKMFKAVLRGTPSKWRLYYPHAFMRWKNLTSNCRMRYIAFTTFWLEKEWFKFLI